ncbi:hypothetical protein [Pedobacter sp. SYSU D00535]|uniref:hypothetical protein n=1 Tax=Pedobacter sp. SYSU D00535 TaxID=2810308 RepID=UPI001A9771E0|nr:hypothetical protein [Pedobacter sp. SYSU D00535]
MRKAIILTLVLFGVVVAMAVMYFSEISAKANNLEKVLKQVPADAALVLNFSNDESFYDIFKDYELFDAIIGESRAGEIQQLQELILRQPDLRELSGDNQIFVSFHPNEADSVDLLFSMNLKGEQSPAEIQELLKELKGVRLAKEDAGFFSLQLGTVDKKFYFFVNKGVALGSYSKELLQESLNQEGKKLEADFIGEINKTVSRNQNSPVNLFVNHATLSDFASSFTRGKPVGNSSLLLKLKGISSLNMNFKSDALMFSGISTVDTSSLNYMNLYLNQQPVKNDIKNLVPDDASNFIAFGFSDQNRFQNSLRSYLNKKKDLSKLQSQLTSIKSKDGVDLEKDLKPLLGNEFIVVERADREKFAIIKLKNGRSVNFTLQLISTSLGSSMSQLNHSNIFYYYFGDPLKAFSRPFFAVRDNYLILSASPGVVQSYLSDYEKQRFLIKTPEFAQYNQLVANKSNILYFINTKNSKKAFAANLKPAYSKLFSDKNYKLQNFYGLSYQWSADGDHFFSNLYLNYKPNETAKKDADWSVNLNGRLVISPQLVQGDSGNLILVQDNSNTLQAISPEGKKQWSISLKDKVLGSLQQLNDRSIIFNTSNRLYRLLPNGQPFEGFPVNLPFNASFGGTLTTSDPSSASLFIPAGNVVMAYNTRGEPIEGWNKSVDSRILFDLKTVEIGNVKYLIAGTTTGRIYFYNQNGTLISKTTASSSGGLKNPIFIKTGTTSADTRVITTDATGALLSISPNGQMEKVSLGTYTSNHYFESRNVAGDEQPELILVDKNHLNVMTAEGNPIFNYEFPAEVKSRPQFFNTNQYFYQIGISLSQENKLFLFNDDGSLVKGFPAEGTGLFSVGTIKGNGIKYLLSTKKDNKLYAFKL